MKTAKEIVKALEFTNNYEVLTNLYKFIDVLLEKLWLLISLMGKGNKSRK